MCEYSINEERGRDQHEGHKICSLSSVCPPFCATVIPGLTKWWSRALIMKWGSMSFLVPGCGGWEVEGTSQVDFPRWILPEAHYLKLTHGFAVSIKWDSRHFLLGRLSHFHTTSGFVHLTLREIWLLRLFTSSYKPDKGHLISLGLTSLLIVRTGWVF